MGSDKRIIYLAGGLAILAAGGLAGLMLGNNVAIQARQPVTIETSSDPVERYDLGQNAFEPPKTNTRPSYAPAIRDQDYRYGRRVNGKRVLVPSEPAIKSEREQLEAEQREFDSWQADTFGGTNTDDPDFHAFDEPETPPEPEPVAAEEYDVQQPVDDSQAP